MLQMPSHVIIMLLLHNVPYWAATWALLEGALLAMGLIGAVMSPTKLHDWTDDARLLCHNTRDKLLCKTCQ